MASRYDNDDWMFGLDSAEDMRPDDGYAVGPTVEDFPQVGAGYQPFQDPFASQPAEMEDPYDVLIKKRNTPPPEEEDLNEVLAELMTQYDPQYYERIQSLHNKGLANEAIREILDAEILAKTQEMSEKEAQTQQKAQEKQTADDEKWAGDFEKKYGVRPDAEGAIEALERDRERLQAYKPSTLRELPGAIKEYTTEDTYVSQQAAGLLTQAMDFIPSKLRGAEETSGQLGGKVDKIRNALEHIPIVKDVLAGADDILDASGNLRQEIKAQLREDAQEQAGMAGVASTEIVDAVEQTLANIKMFRLMKIPYMGKGKAAQVLLTAPARAAVMAATTEGASLEEKAKMFGIGVLYQSTPALSGQAPSDLIAAFADIGLNTMITMPQWSGMVQSAHDRANAEGRPEDAGLYFWLDIAKAHGTDFAYGLMTRSFSPRAPQRDIAPPKGTTAPPKISDAEKVAADESAKKGVQKQEDLDYTGQKLLDDFEKSLTGGKPKRKPPPIPTTKPAEAKPAKATEGTDEFMAEDSSGSNAISMGRDYGVDVIVGSHDIGGEARGSQVSVGKNETPVNAFSADWVGGADFKTTRQYPQNQVTAAHEIAHALFIRTPKSGHSAIKGLIDHGVPPEQAFESAVDLGALYILEPRSITDPAQRRIIGEWIDQHISEALNRPPDSKKEATPGTSEFIKEEGKTVEAYEKEFGVEAQKAIEEQDGAILNKIQQEHSDLSPSEKAIMWHDEAIKAGLIDKSGEPSKYTKGSGIVVTDAEGNVRGEFVAGKESTFTGQHDTHDARAYGMHHKGDEAVIKQLRSEVDQLDKQTEKLLATGKGQESYDKAMAKQNAKEAAEFAEGKVYESEKVTPDKIAEAKAKYEALKKKGSTKKPHKDIKKKGGYITAPDQAEAAQIAKRMSLYGSTEFPYQAIGAKQTGAAVKMLASRLTLADEKALKAVETLSIVLDTPEADRDAFFAATSEQYNGKLSVEQQAKIAPAVKEIKRINETYGKRLREWGVLEKMWPQSHIDRLQENIDSLKSTNSKVRSSEWEPTATVKTDTGKTRTKKVSADTKATLRKNEIAKNNKQIKEWEADIEKLKRLKYMHFPAKLWLSDKYEKDPEGFRSALTGTFSGIKGRKTVDPYDLVKAGVLDPDKVSARDAIGSYIRYVEGQRAMKEIRDSALIEGVVAKPEDAPLGFVKIDKDKYPMFAKYRLHPGFKDLLVDHFDYTMGHKNVVGKFLALTKMAQFFNPLIMPMYDMLQGLALTQGQGFLHTPRAVFDVYNKTPQYFEASHWGLFSQPYKNPYSVFEKDLAKVKEAQGLKQKMAVEVKNFGKGLAFMGPEKNPVAALYSASWRTAWYLDKIIRMGSYQAMIRRGFSPEEAAKLAAEAHADYAGVPPATRKALNRVFFTPTFQISMLKWYGKMVYSTARLPDSTVRAAMGQAGAKEDMKRDFARALSLATAIGAVYAWDQGMVQMLGWEREQFGRKYKKKLINEDGEEVEAVVTFANPLNVPLKYYHNYLKRQEGMNKITQTLSRGQYMLHPAYQWLIHMAKNTRPNGQQIYNPYDSGAVNSVKVLQFSASHYVGMIRGFLQEGKDPKKETLKLLKEKDGKGMDQAMKYFAFFYSRRPKADRLKWKIDKELQNFQKAIRLDVDPPESIEELKVWEKNFNERMDRLLEMAEADQEKEYLEKKRATGKSYIDVAVEYFPTGGMMDWETMKVKAAEKRKNVDKDRSDKRDSRRKEARSQ